LFFSLDEMKIFLFLVESSTPVIRKASGLTSLVQSNAKMVLFVFVLD